MSLWGLILFNHHKYLTELREDDHTSMLLCPNLRNHSRRGNQKMEGLVWSGWQELQDRERKQRTLGRSGDLFRDPLPGSHLFQRCPTTSPDGATSRRPGAKWHPHIPTPCSWRDCCVDIVIIEFTETYYWLGTKLHALSLAPVDFKEK